MVWSQLALQAFLFPKKSARTLRIVGSTDCCKNLPHSAFAAFSGLQERFHLQMRSFAVRFSHTNGHRFPLFMVDAIPNDPLLSNAGSHASKKVLKIRTYFFRSAWVTAPFCLTAQKRAAVFLCENNCS
ncbi:hypothetical protein [Anaerotruncus colihominis]|jgi:hypothetical protein|uniref:hypothetical protein n=1 Tax=Anaerotruncus colihominis TaxID=169435 RepID=UPI00155DCDF5|nr:hypothetical protein [Anaerotruncus colihominis]